LNFPSFTGAGQKFRLRIQAGTESQNYILSLIDPYFLDRPLSLGGDIFYREATFLSVEYNQRNYGFTIDARRPLLPFLALNLNYRLEEIDIFDVALDASPTIVAEAGNHLKSQVGAILNYDTRDSVFLTRHGHRVVLTPFLAGGFLGGNVQTYGFDLQAAQYFLFPFDIILTAKR
jgi:outer membrane protein insertion porin family